MVVIHVVSLKLIFLCDIFVGIPDGIQCHFFGLKMIEINEPAHAHYSKPLTIALMIAL